MPPKGYLFFGDWVVWCQGCLFLVCGMLHTHKATLQYTLCLETGAHSFAIARCNENVIDRCFDIRFILLDESSTEASSIVDGLSMAYNQKWQYNT